MAYIQPNIVSSSIVIDGGPSISYDDGVILNVDREFIMDNEDLIFSLYIAINYALRDLGLDHHESYYRHSLIYEIDDKDIDKFVNLNLEIDASALIDEPSARMYITEFYDFRPSLVKLSGSILIDGFEVVN
jgi:hypothetical protein